MTSYANIGRLAFALIGHTGCDILSSPGVRVSYVVEDLLRELGAKRDDELRTVLVSLAADHVQAGQCLDVVERHLL